MKRARKKQKNRAPSRPEDRNRKLPFIEHIYELRRRLFYVVISVGLWGAAAYFVQQQIVAALLRPAHNQQFIYTSVGGGINFLFSICTYTGIVFSIPVIMFQILKFLEPLIKKDAMRFLVWGSVCSGVLAVAGMAFGYFLGLPAALHFLLHQFTTSQIHPLLTIQSYMSFVTMYMLGSALIFQLPLLVVLINRIKPLPPRKLLRKERWVILVAVVLGGILNPSPRIQDQLMLAGPMILSYQIGVIIVWLTNRKPKRPAKLATLLETDAQRRVQRQEQFARARAALLAASQTAHTQTARPAAAVTPITTVPPRPRGRYYADFASRRAIIQPTRDESFGAEA